MLRSGNELNKPSFSKLRNTNPIGRISKRHCARRKEILRLVNQEYNSYISVSIAEKLIREINEIASYNEQTPEFVDEIREKMFLLHEYNTHVAKIAYTYPTSKEIYELLGRYVALESEVLYKNNCAFKFEKQVENRVFDTIVTFLKDSFSTEEDSLHEERKRVYNEALKVFVSYVDVKYTNDEEKFPARIVKNILDALGLIKKSTDNPSGNLDLNNPSLIRLKESLKDSDYGSDDDGQETASLSSESSFRTMLSKRNHEKTSKKGISNDDDVTCEISPGVSPTDTLESRISVPCSISKSTVANEVIISENLIGESSQSSSIDTAVRNDRGLKSLCNSSRSEPVPNFPSSNEVFSTISPNEIQTFFDFNVDDDIEVIEWSSRKSKSHVEPANSNTQTINKNNNTLSKINTKSVGGNIEYRIYGTISITGSDEEEEDFVYNRTDFDAIKRNFMEQKRSHAILNNLKKRTLEEVSKVFDELDKRKANKSNLASIKFAEPSVCSVKAVTSKENDKNNKWNIHRTKGYANRNKICQSGSFEKTENKIERDDASKTAITIEISSSDEDEPVMNCKNTDGSQRFPLSITNFETPLAKTIAHNSDEGVEIIENNLEVGNNQPSMMKRIFCRPLDELKTVRNPIVPKESEKQVESTSKRNLPTTGFVDLCSENEFDANDIVNLTTDSDVEIISGLDENIQESFEDDISTKQKLRYNKSISSDQVSSERDMRYDSFYHSRVQMYGNSSLNDEITNPVDRRNEAQTEKTTNVCIGERRLLNHSGSGLEQFKPNISIPPLSVTLLKQCSVENPASDHKNNERSGKVTLVDEHSVSIQTEMDQCAIKSSPSERSEGEKFECIRLGKPYFSSQAASSDKTSKICGTDNSTSDISTVRKINTDDENDTKSNRYRASDEDMGNGNEISTENSQVGHSETLSVCDAVECSEKESIAQSSNSQYTSTKTRTFDGENNMLNAGENVLISQTTEKTYSQFEHSPCLLSPIVDEKEETGENQRTLPLSPVFVATLDKEQMKDHQKIENTEDNIINDQLKSSDSTAQIEEQIIDVSEEIETMTSTPLACSVRTSGQLKKINEKLDSGEKIAHVDVDLIHSLSPRSQNDDTTLVTKPSDEEVILEEEDQIFDEQKIGEELKKTSAVSTVINDGSQDTYDRRLDQGITTSCNENGERVIETAENQVGHSIEIQQTTEEASSSYPTNIILGCGQNINPSIEPTEPEGVAEVSGEENSEQFQAIENEGQVLSETSKDLLYGKKDNPLMKSIEDEVPIGSKREKGNIEQFPCEKSTISIENKGESKIKEVLGYDQESIMKSIEKEFIIGRERENEKTEHLKCDESKKSIENQKEIQTNVVLVYDQTNTIMKSMEPGRISVLSEMEKGRNEKIHFENSTETVHNQVEILEPEEAPVVTEEEEEGKQFQSESIIESIDDEGKDSSEVSINEVLENGELDNTIMEVSRSRIGDLPEVSPEVSEKENVNEIIRSENGSESIDIQREVSSDMTINKVLGYSPKCNLTKESIESQKVPGVSQEKTEMNELVQSNCKESIDNQDKVSPEIQTNEVLGEKSNPTMESSGAEAVSLVQAEIGTEPIDINVSSEITHNEKHASMGHDNNQTGQLLDANQFDKGLLDSVINEEMINSSINDVASIKSFTTKTKGNDQTTGDLMNDELITEDPKTENFLNNECLNNERKIVTNNLYAEETVECSDKLSEVQYRDIPIDDSQAILDSEPGRPSIQKSEKDVSNLLKNAIPPTETNKVDSDEQMSPEHFGATNKWLDDEQGKPITCAIEKFAEDDTSQEKITFDDECTSFVIDEEINENIENLQEEIIVSHSDTETKTGPAKCDAKIQNPGKSIVIDKNFDKCEFITLHSAKELEISTTVYSDSSPVPIVVEKDECSLRTFPLTTIVDKYSETSDSTPVEGSTAAITNSYPDNSVDMEIEVPFNVVPDESKEMELTPKARKSRCSDSHNVVGNLGKVMLLMSNNEPRRPKRNISFTSPIKVNDNCVILDTSPTTSSKSIIDVGTRDPPYNSYTDLECNSTTNVSTFSEETLSQLQNTLYSSNNFYSSYISKDTRDNEVFLNIKECVSEKQQLDIDILASVASSQKPLKVNVHHTDKKVDLSKSSRNKRSPSIKSTESKSNTPIKKSPPVSPLDTNTPSIISPPKTSQIKSKSKSSKSNIKSPKSEKKSNSPTTPITARKAKISKNKKTESKLPETETKEEIKKSKKGGRRTKEEGEDKKNLKGSKLTEKSRTKQNSFGKELIIDSSESDDSLPLNVRMKKPTVENATPKNSRKDGKTKNYSKVSKSKEKSKKGVKKRNEEKKLIIDCTQEKELDAKTQIISDKLDKHKVTSPPVKEDPSRRIVHFKKAMLELISLDENNGKNLRTNESGEVQKSLIPCDDNENGQSRTFQDTNNIETADKHPCSSIHVDNTIIIEPSIWNSPPEVVVEYKELTENNSPALEKRTEDLSTSRVSDTSNITPIVEHIPRSDNNLVDIRNSFISSYVLPYVSDESRPQEAIKPAVSTITIDKNIREISGTAFSNSNTMVDDPMQTIILSDEVSIESLSTECSETKMVILDSSSLEKQSENEIRETGKNIERSEHHAEENDKIEKIDDQEQINYTKNEYSEVKYPSLNSKEQNASENTIENQEHNILDIKIEKCCEKNDIENVYEKKIKHGAGACRSSDLKISLEIPDTILDLKSSELNKSEENLHRSSKAKLKIKNELSTPRTKNTSRSMPEPKNKDLNVHKEFDNTISLGDGKHDVVVRNEKEEILSDCAKNDTMIPSDAEIHQSYRPPSSAQDLEQKQKNIPTEKECEVSSCIVMKKENYRKKSKKTRNLYDTKKDSLVENISAEIKEKKKESSNVKQNIDKFGKKQEHKVCRMKEQEIKPKEILSEPFILLEKLSTKNEKNKEKIEGKTRDSKRKRSDSEASERIRAGSKYTGSNTETYKEIKSGYEKHEDKLAKTEIKDEKLFDSKSKHEGRRTRSRRNREKSVKSKLINQCVGEPKNVFSATKNISDPENKTPEVELLRKSANRAADKKQENKVIEQKQEQIKLLEENKISIIRNQCEEECNSKDIFRTIPSEVSSKNSKANEDTNSSTIRLYDVDPKDDNTCVSNKNECSPSIDDENNTEKQAELSTLKSDVADLQEEESENLAHLTSIDSADKDDSIRNLCFKFGDVTLEPRKSLDVVTHGKKYQETDEVKSQLTSDTCIEESQAQPLELEENCGEVLESIKETKLNEEAIGNGVEEDLFASQNPIMEIEISTNVEIESIPHEQASEDSTIIQDIVPEGDNIINTAESKTESNMETTLDQEPIEFVDHTGADRSNSSKPILEIENFSHADNQETKLNEQVTKLERSAVVSEDKVSELHNSTGTTNDEQESTMETKPDPHASKFVADGTERKMSVDLNPILEIETSMISENEKPYPKAATKPDRQSLEFVEVTEEFISVNADLGLESENSKNETSRMEKKLDQQPSELAGEGRGEVLLADENPVVEIEISTTVENEETKMETKNKQQLLESEKVTEENIAVSPNRLFEIEISSNFENDEACSKNEVERNEQFFDSVEVTQVDLSACHNQEPGMDMDVAKQPPSTLVVDETEGSQNPSFEVEISTNAGNQAICSTNIEEMKTEGKSAEFEEVKEESAIDQYPVIERNNEVDSSNDKEESTIESKLDSQSPTFVDDSEKESQTPVLEIEISTTTEKEETCNKMETNLIEQTLKFAEVPEENISVDRTLIHHDNSTQSTVKTTQQPLKFVGDEIERTVVVGQNPVLEIEISTNTEIGQACPEMGTKLYEKNIEFEKVKEEEMALSQGMVLEHRNLIPSANDPSLSVIETELDQPSSELVDTTEEDVVVSQSPAIELEISSDTENAITVLKKDDHTTECVKDDNDEDINRRQNLTVDGSICSTYEKSEQQSSEISKDEIEGDILVSQNPVLEIEVSTNAGAICSTNEKTQKLPSEISKDEIEGDILASQNLAIEIEVSTNAEYEEIPSRTETLIHQSQQYEDITEENMASQDKALDSKTKLMDPSDNLDLIEEETACRNIADIAPQADEDGFQEPVIGHIVEIEFIGEKSNSENESMTKQMEDSSSNSGERLILHTSIDPPTLPNMNPQEPQMSEVQIDARANEVSESPKNKRKRQEEIDEFTVTKKCHLGNEITKPSLSKVERDEEKICVSEEFCHEKQKHSILHASPQANGVQNSNRAKEEREQDSHENNNRSEEVRDYENGGNNPLKHHIKSIVATNDSEVPVTKQISIVKTKSIEQGTVNMFDYTEKEIIIGTSGIFENGEIQFFDVKKNCSTDLNRTKSHTSESNSSSLDALEGSDHGLNLKIPENLEGTAENNIEETITGQIVQHPTTIVKSVQSTSAMTKLPKNELSFSIERMLKPSPKNQPTSAHSAAAVEMSEAVVSTDTGREQTSSIFANDNKKPDTFKHPGIMNNDKSDSKQNKISSVENQRKKKNKKKEKFNPALKVEENRKVIVERVYSMNELAGGTKISPCLNLCSAPILPISKEFIPYRYGIYSRVNPTTDMGHSYSNPVENEGVPNVTSYRPSDGAISQSKYTPDSPAKHQGTNNDLSHSEESIKYSGDIHKLEPKTLQSENDIEIVQVEGSNRDFEMKPHEIKNAQMRNHENTERFIIEDNVDESIRLKVKDSNVCVQADVDQPFDSTPTYRSEVQQVDNSMQKSDNEQKLQTSGDAAGGSKRSFDYVMNIEPRVRTIDTRKSIESIVSCLKSKESDKKAEFHSNDQTKPPSDKLEILNAGKETEIRASSISEHEVHQSASSCLNQSDEINNIAPPKILDSNIERPDSALQNMNQKPDIQGQSNEMKPTSIPSYDVEGADDIVTDELEATRGKSTCDSTPQSHKIETSKVGYPQSEVSPLFNTNLEQQDISDSFVNQVIAHTASEGIDSLLTSFQSAISESIAENISTLQGSFSLFSNSSDDNIPFTPPNHVHNEGILQVNFQDKAVLPLSQPEVFINNRLNIPQSTPLRPQGTSQTDHSIFNISDDIFDFDFNTVNQATVDGSYSNSYVNTTMTNENLQMFLDNPSEFLHLLCNFNDVGCEVTVDNTNEEIISNPSIAPGLIPGQLIDSIPPYIAEEEFDSNAPTDPMVGGQKELLPDPKQDPNLDEAPFPESALSFDEDMMHRYALFLHCDVNSTTQSTDVDGLSKEKVSREPDNTPVRHETSEKQQTENELARNEEDSGAARSKKQNIASVPQQDTKVDVKDDFSSCSTSKITEQPQHSGSHKRDMNKQPQSKSPKTSSPNNSTDSQKSTKKANGKNPGKVQKIPASKYAPPKKTKNDETHQSKKPQEKAEVKQSKYSASNEKVGNLTFDIEFNNSLDMPQLLSPTGNTSWKSKSLPTYHNNKNESKTVESERREAIAQTTPEKTSEDDPNQLMQFNMYDRTKAMKRNAARDQNYCKFYDEGDNSSSKNKKRKVAVKTEQTVDKPNVPSYSPRVPEHLECKDFENKSKLPNVEDSLPVVTKESVVKKLDSGEIPQKSKNPIVRDLDYEFDRLKNSGPYKSSSSKNVGYTRTDRILRSAQEGDNSHYQMSPTSSQYNYNRGKREDYRRYPDSNRKVEDYRRKPNKVQDRSRSPHHRSSAYASTSSDYRRESSRRPTQQEMKRNDSSHGRNPQTCSEERRRTLETHHPRDTYKKVNRWPKRDCPDYQPPGPLFNRPYSNQSQQKNDSKRGDKYLEVLDKLYPLQTNVFPDAGR
ncbi:uncharacterized protein LOC123306754 [Coccinella septempunctata]|uniref:uncharacterized protein LOC123306754 n=1 Tax=Coccinella septempunctata TaxID=41139 RepID=UPI001D08F4F3|nr:uncharacterized protein LOC123306754 [Coccinella septempunctata]